MNVNIIERAKLNTACTSLKQQYFSLIGCISIFIKKLCRAELEELTNIYMQRGLNEELARKTAEELTAHNALETHARDELGINEIKQANPFMAAFASAISFVMVGSCHW
ncbi:VIT1/CCC1 transporter family protein [Flavobacterium limi]|uniref:Uncharacterized protein n=1 Tax=Flavobacterium limi TaxID=2045105 RepID=A0ABQ1UMQ6_9FLAO|nr:VIT1/CCC1 transporter family protein [Flavobacterium limi]GGF22692.1 hypothetical protein GCM10011518_34910 [Flavobacterium limi]